MKTPVLLLMFNRPDTTARVFDAIRKAKPSKLFIAADGARNDAEWDLCNKTRDVVKNVDWECEVHTLFRDKNLGLGNGMDSAISWFFDNVEQGIILEDDCLPDPSFFTFCENMLDRYKDNENIGMISGDNFIQEKTLQKINPDKDEYYLIRPVFIWGWASWRRAWQKHDLSMKQWPEVKKNGYIKTLFKNKNVANSFIDSFNFVYNKGSHVWDIPWFFACLMNKMLCIIPPRNLISNIGVIGSHTVEETPFHNMKAKHIDVTILRHPQTISANIEIENSIFCDIGASTFSYRRYLIQLIDFFGLHNLVKKIYRFFKFKI